MLTLKSALASIRFDIVDGTGSKKRKRTLFSRFFVGTLRSMLDSEEHALQLTSLGRALPVGTAAVSKKALQRHKEAYRSDSDTPEHLVEACYEFVDDWIRAYCPPNTSEISFPSTSGAAIGYPRKKGGLAAYTHEVSSFVQQVRAPDQLLSAVQGPLVSGIGPDMTFSRRIGRARDVVLQTAVRENLFSRLSLLSEPYRAEVIPIAERGCKARVVTKSPPELVASSHYVRTVLFRGILRDPRTSEALQGDRTKAVLGLLRGYQPPGHWQVLSSDLTAASDLLPSDLIQAVVEAIVDSEILPPSFEPALRASVGVMKLVYPDGEEILSRRGILMGLPTTWTILSLIHLFIIEQAFNEVAFVGPRLYRICGDDLVAIAPKKVIDSYHRIASACGVKFSAGKHFVSHRYAVFTEVIAKVNRSVTDHRNLLGDDVYEKFVKQKRHRRLLLVRRADKGEVISSLSLVRYIPLKGLVKPDLIGGSFDPCPWWVSLGPSAASIAEQSRSPGRVRNIVKALFPFAWHWFASRGIPPNLPRELGGGGLPSKSGNPNRCYVDRWCRPAVRHYLYGRSFLSTSDLELPWVSLGSSGGPWALASQMADQRAVPRLMRVTGPKGSVRMKLIQQLVPVRSSKSMASPAVNYGGWRKAFREHIVATARKHFSSVGFRPGGGLLTSKPTRIASAWKRAVRHAPSWFRRDQGKRSFLRQEILDILTQQNNKRNLYWVTCYDKSDDLESIMDALGWLSSRDSQRAPRSE
uniref:RNA dependent RNA polymerase n=1 Tax=Barley aphid RNA virus 6 TaxID=2703495 RepID=A0A6F8QHB1_9VIRU|nr:RNA dependent RNA polymerase [Barley aphid RNA virus 6]